LHIETRTVSAVASESFNNVFSSTYDYYKVITSLIGSTTLNINLRLRVAGADNSADNYRRQNVDITGSTLAAGRATGETSWVDALGGITTSDRNFSFFEIANPFLNVNTSAVKYNSRVSGANIEGFFTFFGIANSASYTGFSAIATTGNFTGTISIYGYRK